MPIGVDDPTELYRSFTYHRDTTHGAFRTKTKVVEEFYELRFMDSRPYLPRQLREPDGNVGSTPFHDVTPTTAYEGVESAANHILTNPKISVPHRQRTAARNTEREIAERKQQFLNQWWDESRVEFGNRLGQVAKNIVLYGKGVLKVQLRPGVLAGRPEAAEAEYALGADEFMWELKAPPPSTIINDTDNLEDPMWVYETYQISHDTARRMYPNVDLPMNVSLNSKVEYVEYWEKPSGTSRGKRTVWVAGKVAFDGPNPYRWIVGAGSPDRWAGYIPYYVVPSGWGIQTDDNDADRYYVGIIERQVSVLIEEAKQATAASVQLALATFPPLIGYGVSQEQLNAFRLGPGARFAVPAGDNNARLEFLRVPEPPQGVYSLLSLAASYSADVTKQGALGGSPQSGVGSATEAEATNRSATAKLNDPVEGLQLMVQRVCRHRLMDVEHLIGQPVSLLGTHASDETVSVLRADEIRGEYGNRVKLSTTGQSAIDRIDARFALDARQRAPELSPEWVLSHIPGVENPQQMIEEAKAAQLFDSPAMQQVFTLWTMALLGDLAEAPRQALERQLDSAVLGPGGRPGTRQWGWWNWRSGRGRHAEPDRWHARDTAESG